MKLRRKSAKRTSHAARRNRLLLLVQMLARQGKMEKVLAKVKMLSTIK